MSTTKHPILTAIQPLHLNETRCLNSAIKIQKDPEDTNAYCEFQNELDQLKTHLKTTEHTLQSIAHQQPSLTQDIHHRLAYTQALIQELDQIDNKYLDNPQSIKQSFYQRNLNTLMQNIQNAHEQTLAFFAGTRKSINPPTEHRRKKLEPLQLPTSKILKPNKIIIFPTTYRKPRHSMSAKKSKNHKCQLIQLPIGEMNQPVNHNTPKP